MKDIERIINTALNEFNEMALDVKTKNDLIERLSVYHEELSFQNDELRKINEQLESTKAGYERLFMESPVGNVLINEQGVIQKFNHYAADLFDHEIEADRPFNQFIAPDDQDKYYLFIRETLHTKTGQQVELSSSKMTGSKRIHLISQRVSREEEEAMIHLAMIDETKAYRYRTQVEYLSYHDQLTGLFNRRYFDEALNAFSKGNEHPVSLIIADVNGLKLINDAYGHAAGDKLIAEVAKRLKDFSREEDIVARHGGDEFAIIMLSAGEDDVKKQVMKLDACCEDVIMKDIKLSVAFGYATNHSATQSIEAVFQLAEDRMYKNKLYKKTSRKSELINGMMVTLQEKKPWEKEHSERVSLLATNLGKAIGMDEAEIQEIRTAALLHDIGKIAVDYDILTSSTPLNEQEKEELEKHTEIGYRILNASSDFSEIAEIVLSHHERPDGRGYPRGLRDKDIPIASKVLAIADAYDTMMNDQFYRSQMTVQEAVEEMEKGAGTQFDEFLVNTFIDKVVPD